VRDVEKSPNKGDSDDALTFIGPPGDCVFEDDSDDGDPGMLIFRSSGHQVLFNLACRVGPESVRVPPELARSRA